MALRHHFSLSLAFGCITVLSLNVLTSWTPLKRSMSTRYHTLDHWRGIACLIVVVFHSTHYVADASFDARVKSGGASIADALIWTTSRFWVGVPMFFVISGYCIAASALSHAKHERPAGEFFKRRLRRIFPPYWALFVVAMGFVLLCQRLLGHNGNLTPPWELSGSQLLGNLLLIETWRSHFFGDETRFFMGHVWTLCYEEQFYLATGLILLTCRRYFFLGCLGLSLVVLALRALPDRPNFIAGLFLDGYFLQFAAGIAVCYAANFANRFEKVATVTALIVAFAWCVKQPGQLLSLRANWEQSYAVAFAFAVLLIALHRHDQRLNSLKVLKPLGIAGVMCYSLYLVHAPFCAVLRRTFYEAGLTTPGQTLLVTTPVCLALSWVVAWPFHVFIEQRFMSSGKTER